MRNKNRVIRNMFIGMIGIAIWIAACWLMGAYGEGNVKNGLIQSNWAKMPALRFEISIALASVGIPLYYYGARDFIKAVRLSRRKKVISDHRMASLFDFGISVGCVSFLYFHAIQCLIPVVYKMLYTTNLMSADIMNSVESVYYYTAIPMWVLYISAHAAVTISFIYLVIQERLNVSKICILFNPLVFWGISEGLKFTKIFYLVDFAAAAVPFGYLILMACGVNHVAHIKERRRRRTD